MMNTLDAVYVLIYYAGDGCSCLTATACNGLYVSLYTGAAQRLTAGY